MRKFSERRNRKLMNFIRIFFFFFDTKNLHLHKRIINLMIILFLVCQKSINNKRRNGKIYRSKINQKFDSIFSIGKTSRFEQRKKQRKKKQNDQI